MEVVVEEALEEGTIYPNLPKGDQITTAKLSILFACVTLFLVSCQSSWKQPLPAGEIVYMSGDSVLGFVQEDGKNNKTLEVAKNIAIPIWSKNSKFLYGLSGGWGGTYAGFPAIWDIESGRFKICGRNSVGFDLIQSLDDPLNPYRVIVQHIWEIVLMDLRDCKRIETFVDYTDHPGEYSMSGFSYFPSTHKLVYGLVVKPYRDREYRIIQLDVETGEQVQLAEGINPSWSPDGTRIAYLGLDGLYVLEANGAEPKRLTTGPFFDPWGAGATWSISPIPRWSPDGKWLVYHRCDTADICMSWDAKIYKISSTGGPEILIYPEGKYPSWGDR